MALYPNDARQAGATVALSRQVNFLNNSIGFLLNGVNRELVIQVHSNELKPGFKLPKPVVSSACLLELGHALHSVSKLEIVH